MKVDSEKLKTGGTWLGGLSGIGVPGYQFFTSFPPPLFPGISLITAGLSSAILFIVLAWRPKADRRSAAMPRVVHVAGRYIGSAVLLLVFYVLLFGFTTIGAPSGKRLQIGFGRATWSLTDAGRDWVKTQPTITVVQMVTNEAAFEQDRIGILWTTWSINLAGALLILLFVLCFASWTTGFALLVKHRTVTQKIVTKP
jgi:hypothetical protein